MELHELTAEELIKLAAIPCKWERIEHIVGPLSIEKVNTYPWPYHKVYKLDNNIYYIFEPKGELGFDILSLTQLGWNIQFNNSEPLSLDETRRVIKIKGKHTVISFLYNGEIKLTFIIKYV